MAVSAPEFKESLNLTGFLRFQSATRLPPFSAQLSRSGSSERLYTIFDLAQISKARLNHPRVRSVMN